MAQAIEAYRRVSATDEFRELERARHYMRANEASALANAERKEREKWLRVVAEKDAMHAAELADLRKEIERLTNAKT